MRKLSASLNGQLAVNRSKTLVLTFSGRLGYALALLFFRAFLLMPAYIFRSVSARIGQHTRPRGSVGERK